MKTMLKNMALRLKEGQPIECSFKTATAFWDWLVTNGATKTRKGVLTIHGWEISFGPSKRKFHQTLTAKEVANANS